MISTYTLLLFLLKHNQNGVFNSNVRYIKESVHSDDPATAKFKPVCTYLPKISLVTKGATPGEVQVTYARASSGNKSLGETVTNFSLEGFLEVTTLVTISSERAFAGSSNKIHLPATKVLLSAASWDLSKLNKICYWAAMNYDPLPSFLTKAVILKGETALGKLLNTLPAQIAERG